MKILSKMLIILILMLSLSLFASCGDDPPEDDPPTPVGPPVTDNNPFDDLEGWEGPLVDFVPNP